VPAFGPCKRRALNETNTNHLGEASPIEASSFEEMEASFESEVQVYLRSERPWRPTVRVGTAREFFERGRNYARRARAGARLPESRLISFEDPDDMMRIPSPAKLKLAAR
jgi:hypothetical protein